MTFRLPDALQVTDDGVAIGLLKQYFGEPYLSPGCADGAYFDTWAVDSDPFWFTADDLIAIKFLSVEAPKTAVLALLRDRAEEFSKLLFDLGPDRDLADVEHPLDNGWVGWQLMYELKAITGVGTTTASKLLARKRPGLRPIWDPIVAAVTDTAWTQWEPMRLQLRADGGALQQRLLRLRAEAGIPDTVSALRVLDVIAWREGKNRTVGRR